MKGRWVAIMGAGMVAALCYGLGAISMGFAWLPEWLDFARRFAEMNFASNSYQMTNLVAGAKQLQVLGIFANSTGENLTHIAVALSAVIVGVWACKALRPQCTLFSAYLALPSLLAVATPQANFYDLGLSAFPLLILFAVSVPSQRNLLVVVWCGAALASLGRFPGTLPWFVVLAVSLHLLICRATRMRMHSAR
jgi:hypothetical protein